MHARFRWPKQLTGSMHSLPVEACFLEILGAFFTELLFCVTKYNKYALKNKLVSFFTINL